MNAFERLAPFLQEYIYRNRWEALREVQNQAIETILDTNAHVLITSGTASGKTEAAFFPILTLLHNQPVQSVGVLYISPLKALINDQFSRIERLLEEQDIPFFAWHGDRRQSEKDHALKNPNGGILLITPESLEALLIRRPGDAARMFSRLRFVVIDEVHAFAGTDRGSQLQCLLSRLPCDPLSPPRRIGLSATLADPQSAGAWLAAETKLPVKIITGGAEEKKLLLTVRHDTMPEDASDPTAALHDAERLQYLYSLVRGRKCLLFTNSRQEAENTAASLRHIAQENHDCDCFVVHHGSLSSALRADAEEALKDAENAVTAVATKTLELGIDLGQLERVIQSGAPDSCSAFVQRLGRSGRRGGPAVMCFLTRSHASSEPSFNALPWQLLQSIAILELSLRDQYLEPIIPKTYPFSLLFHQTLCVLFQSPLSGRTLAQKLLSMPPFENIEPDDLLILLRHMLHTGYLLRSDDGELLPGPEAEHLLNDYRFYSVFSENGGMKVMHLQRLVGEIDNIPTVGHALMLGGSTWVVRAVDEKKSIVHVEPGTGKLERTFSGKMPQIGDIIAQKVREILTSESYPPYLQQSAKDALAEARTVFSNVCLCKNATPLGNGMVLLHPFFGSRLLNTLRFLLRTVLKKPLKIKELLTAEGGLGLYVITDLEEEMFFDLMTEKVLNVQEEELLPHIPTDPIDRYDSYLPEELLKKAFLHNILDLPGLQEQLEINAHHQYERM